MVPRPILSSFGNHIAHVIALSADEEMRWIDAKPVVAAVKNASAVIAGKLRHWAVVDFIAHSVSGSFKLPQRNKTISVFPRSQFPGPAFIRATNIRICPEFGGNILCVGGNSMGNASAYRRTKPSIFCLTFPLDREAFPACVTGFCWKIVTRRHVPICA